MLWHDVPGSGPGADSREAGRRAIRSARLGLRFQELQRKPISPARDNSGGPNASQEKRLGTGLFSLSQHYREGIQYLSMEMFPWPLPVYQRLVHSSQRLLTAH